MIRIAHFWKKDPNWLMTLEKPEKNKLIADYILFHESQKDREKREKRYKNKVLEERIKNVKNKREIR